MTAPKYPQFRRAEFLREDGSLYAVIEEVTDGNAAGLGCLWLCNRQGERMVGITLDASGALKATRTIRRNHDGSVSTLTQLG